METQYNPIHDMVGISIVSLAGAMLWFFAYVQPRTTAIHQVIDCMPDRTLESYELCKDMPNESR